MKNYLIWKEDTDISEAKKIFAFEDQQAVENWAEKSDKRNTDYSIANGNAQRVYVAEEGKEQECKLFEVVGHVESVYCATEV